MSPDELLPISNNFSPLPLPCFSMSRLRGFSRLACILRVVSSRGSTLLVLSNPIARDQFLKLCKYNRRNIAMSIFEACRHDLHPRMWDVLLENLAASDPVLLVALLLDESFRSSKIIPSALRRRAAIQFLLRQPLSVGRRIAKELFFFGRYVAASSLWAVHVDPFSPPAYSRMSTPAVDDPVVRASLDLLTVQAHGPRRSDGRRCQACCGDRQLCILRFHL